jgi:hypothetical protein
VAWGGVLTLLRVKVTSLVLACVCACVHVHACAPTVTGVAVHCFWCGCLRAHVHVEDVCEL